MSTLIWVIQHYSRTVLAPYAILELLALACKRIIPIWRIVITSWAIIIHDVAGLSLLTADNC